MQIIGTLSLLQWTFLLLISEFSFPSSPWNIPECFEEKKEEGQDSTLADIHSCMHANCAPLNLIALYSSPNDNIYKEFITRLVLIFRTPYWPFLCSANLPLSCTLCWIPRLSWMPLSKQAVGKRISSSAFFWLYKIIFSFYKWTIWQMWEDAFLPILCLLFSTDSTGKFSLIVPGVVSFIKEVYYDLLMQI